MLRNRIVTIGRRMCMLQSQCYCTQSSTGAPVDEDLGDFAGENNYNDSSRLYPVMTGERGVNKVTLVGRVGNDPECRGSADKNVTLLSLATSRSYRDMEGSFKQYTDWHRIAIFYKPLSNSVMNNVKKGDKIYVSGALRYSVYTDSQGVTRKATSIVADDVISLKNAPSRSDENS